MTDLVPTDDCASIESPLGGQRQHAPADVAPELYGRREEPASDHATPTQ
ncbi:MULTISPECIES: hypothetical protein [Halobellus]|nr:MULTISPECIES: hypothetical protein [Halobellus]MDQ2055758.1 hypothetical protein [Halobellus sp. H-GB7]